MSPASFAQREGFIWLDGTLVPWANAHTHVLTHALHYGSAVFEGARVHRGAIFKLREHTFRPARSALLLDFEIPFSAEQIDSATRELIRSRSAQRNFAP
jgi:branched-chain amino acid aminotransferase